VKHYYPNFEEFCRLVEGGNTIPVYRQLLSDSLTPVSAYQRLAHPPGFAPAANSLLLESVVGGERIARFSFVGVDPDLTFTARRDQITVRRVGHKSETFASHDPLGELHKLLADFKAVHLPDLPRFTGGVVGYAGYDTIRYYERLGEGPPDDRGLPDMSFGLYRTMVIFDNVSKTIKVVCNAHVTGDPGRRIARPPRASSGRSSACATAATKRWGRSRSPACRRRRSRATSADRISRRRLSAPRSTFAPATSFRWCSANG
jgi:anthranilate synthase component I